MRPVRNAILALTAVIAVVPLSAASAAGASGKCKVTGPAGAYSIAPAIPGQLTVQTHLPAPGWWNGARPDEIEDGFEYCLAVNIAHRLGLARVQVVDVAWPGTAGGASFWQAMLTAQDLPFDLALAEISITPERAALVDFSVPYYRSDIGLMAKAGAGLDLVTIDGLRVGVQAGTTGAVFADRMLMQQKAIRHFGDAPAMFMALQSGAIDAAMTDTAILLSQSAASGGRFEVVGQFATAEEYGALYPKNSPNRATLDAVIRSLIDDGTVAALTSTWLTDVWGQDPAQIPYLRPADELVTGSGS
jgi:polar amino acid transport system substrate-binding protein